MADIAKSFAGIASGFSAAIGGPYHLGYIVTRGTPTLDAGGSIIAPASDTRRACKIQVASPSERERAAEGFTETDAALLIPAATLAGDLDSGMIATIDKGPHKGTTWALLPPVSIDSMGVTWRARARRQKESEAG